jgi:hypothetical protein
MGRTPELLPFSKIPHPDIQRLSPRSFIKKIADRVRRMTQQYQRSAG